jgi:hypothetical protein
VETSGGESGNVQTHGRLTGLHNKPTGCSASRAYAPGPEEGKKEKKEEKLVFKNFLSFSVMEF